MTHLDALNRAKHNARLKRKDYFVWKWLRQWEVSDESPPCRHKRVTPEGQVHKEGRVS